MAGFYEMCRGVLLQYLFACKTSISTLLTLPSTYKDRIKKNTFAWQLDNININVK